MIFDEDLKLSKAITTAATAGTAVNTKTDVIDFGAITANTLSFPKDAKLVIETAVPLTIGSTTGATLKVVAGKAMSGNDIDVSGTQGSDFDYIYSYTGASGATKKTHIVHLPQLNSGREYRYLQILVGQTKVETNSLTAFVTLETPHNSAALSDI